MEPRFALELQPTTSNLPGDFHDFFLHVCNFWIRSTLAAFNHGEHKHMQLLQKSFRISSLNLSSIGFYILLTSIQSVGEI